MNSKTNFKWHEQNTLAFCGSYQWTIFVQKKVIVGKFQFQQQKNQAFTKFIEIGDSLIKEKGSLDIRLIRNKLDTVFTIDYGCDK